MIQSANQRNITEIFNPDLKVKYFIPKYQREYVWTKEQWDNFINDILENENGHFIGSIICINKSTDAIDIAPLEIVDGQQRLTTISLLFAAIYKELLKHKPKSEDVASENIYYELTSLKHRIILKGKENETRIELSEQKNNDLDYKNILKDIGLIKSCNRAQNAGNRRIYRAFNFLHSKLENKAPNELMEILEKLNSCVLVKIQVNNHCDAFTLFESLNNRGLPLSAVDLIKNNILSRFEVTKKKTIDDAFNDWKIIVDENLPDYKIQERFLRQYYNAFKFKNEIKIDKINRAIYLPPFLGQRL